VGVAVGWGDAVAVGVAVGDGVSVGSGEGVAVGVLVTVGRLAATAERRVGTDSTAAVEAVLSPSITSATPDPKATNTPAAHTTSKAIKPKMINSREDCIFAL
jgi:hypothetical protein